LEELQALSCDDDTYASEQQVYALACRWCGCISPFTPDGETVYLRDDCWR
jgi:hypothetical protein